MGVALDANQNLIISDTQNQRVREVTAGIIQTVAGTGVAGMGSGNQLAAQTQLSNPRSTCLASSGTLYIVDTGNHRILSISKTAILAVAAGNGTAGFSGDNAQAWLAQFNQPSACAVDAVGNLFIADTWAHPQGHPGGHREYRRGKRSGSRGSAGMKARPTPRN